MGFHDGLCQRQAQPDALLVLGKAAAVEPLENMVQVLRMDAAAVVLDRKDNICVVILTGYRKFILLFVKVFDRILYDL